MLVRYIRAQGHPQEYDCRLSHRQTDRRSSRDGLVGCKGGLLRACGRHLARIICGFHEAHILWTDKCTRSSSGAQTSVYLSVNIFFKSIWFPKFSFDLSDILYVHNNISQNVSVVEFWFFASNFFNWSVITKGRENGNLEVLAIFSKRF